MTREPPGPPRSVLPPFIYGPGRNPLTFFTNLIREYGNIVRLQTAGEHVFIVNEPHLIRDVLVTHQRSFKKGRGLERAKRLLGDGLLTSEGSVHLRQRRLMQPAFHRDRIASYATVMADYAQRISGEWREGQAFDAAQDMMRLTMAIAGKTLFDEDVESQARDVSQALTDVMGSFWLQMLPFYDRIERLPIPALRRSRAARDRLDRIIYGLIAERRRSLQDRGDLLSMLILAQDDEAGGKGMTDEQVRDEAMTVFLAGHETTANALAWTWYLLADAPEVERKLHEEVDRVLHGRSPEVTDLRSLTFVEQVVTESMRLYPPAWIIGRRALEDYQLDAYHVPKHSILIMSPYLIHRDSRFYCDPDRFQPERWTPGFKDALPPFAYFPFGGGARRCIGESFAWMELVLVVSTIVQRWTLRLVPGHKVAPQPVVTLRMKHGLRMIPHART